MGLAGLCRRFASRFLLEQVLAEKRNLSYAT